MVMAQQVIYSDIPINMNIHPITGDLVRITNASSISQALKNLVLTNKYERFWKAQRGSSVSQTLFDNAVADTEDLISKQIEQAIAIDEPRADNISVILVPDFDRNRYQCTITYTPINTLEPVTLNVILNRVR